jgi:hypothetical protein
MRVPAFYCPQRCTVQKISRQLLDYLLGAPILRSFELSKLTPRGFVRASAIGHMEPRYLVILSHVLNYLQGTCCPVRLLIFVTRTMENYNSIELPYQLNNFPLHV